jgi:hypothetical protein
MIFEKIFSNIIGIQYFLEIYQISINFIQKKHLLLKVKVFEKKK